MIRHIYTSKGVYGGNSEIIFENNSKNINSSLTNENVVIYCQYNKSKALIRKSTYFDKHREKMAAENLPLKNMEAVFEL